MTEDSWPSDWLRGVLGLAVLRAVAGGDTYGYAIAQALHRAGLGSVKGGTLYPLLSRFEQAGLLTTRWEPGDGGPGRKHYALTDAGRAQLAEDAARWTRFARVTTAFVTATEEARP